MSTYTWPSESALIPTTVNFGVVDRTMMAESPYTGGIVTGEVPFSFRRRATIGWSATPDFALQERRIAWLMKIRRSHRVRFWNFRQPVPAGTISGVPTVSGSAAQGSTTIGIQLETSNQTVRMGDWIGLPTSAGIQVVTCVADAQASGTALSMTFEPPLRAAATVGGSVTWNAPAPLWMMASTDWMSDAGPRRAEPLIVDFIEVW